MNPEREDVVEREAEKIARAFHGTYERLAPAVGYETRKASAVEWDAVPQANRELMIATVDALLTAEVIHPKSTLLAAQRRVEEAERERDNEHQRAIAIERYYSQETRRAESEQMRAEKAESDRDAFADLLRRWLSWIDTPPWQKSESLHDVEKASRSALAANPQASDG